MVGLGNRDGWAELSPRDTLKEEGGCKFNSPGRFIAHPERVPSVLASRTKDKEGL